MGYRAGLGGAVAANLLLNFFFIEPRYQLRVQERQSLAELAAFLVVALIGARMLAKKDTALSAALRSQDELDLMLKVSRSLAAASTPRMALDHLVDGIRMATGADSCAIHEERVPGFTLVASTNRDGSLTREQQSLARAAIESSGVVYSRPFDALKAVVRPGRGRRGDAYVPVRPLDGVPAVLLLGGMRSERLGTEQTTLLAGLADEAALTLHRHRLAERARTAAALQHADEVKSALLGSVSHNLRSPLAGIKAAVGNLRDDAVEWDSADRAEFLATIETQTDRLATMVESLLQLSTLEGRAVTPLIERIEAAPLLADAAAAAELATRGREVHLDTRSGEWVLADYALLFHALMNLVENAAKYSRPGGAITLDNRSDGLRAILTIGDEGPGIPESDRERVFAVLSGRGRSWVAGLGARSRHRAGNGATVERACLVHELSFRYGVLR